MNELFIVLEDMRDWKPYYPSDSVITANEFLMSSSKDAGGKAHIINLCRSYKYLSLGWYVSLLAEGRKQKVLPDTSSILNISKKNIYSLDLDEVNNEADKILNSKKNRDNQHLYLNGFSIRIFFGQTDLAAFSAIGRQVYDLFNIPILEIQFKKREKWQIEKISPVQLKSLTPEDEDMFVTYLQKFTRQVWRTPKSRQKSRYDFAVLYDPDELHPPSNKKALEKFAKCAKALNIQLDLIRKSDYPRLGEYDALLIRETTSVENHTYLFSKKAEAEGLVVIDDPKSILRCTNKIYLANLLERHKVPHPKTVFVTKEGYAQNPQIFDQLGYPFIIKIPDGSFSRGMTKINEESELPAALSEYFRQSDLVLAQEFVYTEFDWRIGILNRKPVFACQYYMSRGHWQIYNHNKAKLQYGKSRTYPVIEVPKKVVSTALKAASLIGDGLYGVDIKESENGPLVVEVNDNPNIDAGCEDEFLGDDLYTIILEDLLRRLEIKHQQRH